MTTRTPSPPAGPNNNIMNDSADYYYYELGVNPIPADTKNKTINLPWKEYQDKSIPDEVHESRKKLGHYDKGIAIILGKVFRGKNIGQYLVGIDIDRETGLREFLTKNNKYLLLTEFAKKTLVEQHKDELHKAHVYFYSPIPFPQKTPDSVLGIEIKSEGEHGTMFVSPSVHKNGFNYERIGPTKEPLSLSPENAIELMSHIDSVCRKYDIDYLQSEKNNKILTEPLRQIIDSLDIPADFQYRIPEGRRHVIMLSLANKLLIKYRNKISRDELKNFFIEVNDKICLPPLSKNELIDSIWRDALRYSEKIVQEIKIINNDEYDKANFNTPIVVPLIIGDKLLEQEIVQTFVYDTRAESVDYTLNHKYDLKKIIVPINIKKWDVTRKNLEKSCEEKGISKEHTLLLLDSLDNNNGLIKKIYYDNHRQHIAAIAAAEERKKERLQLIAEGTDFVISKYRFLTIEETKDILFYDPNNSGVYVYGGDIQIDKELDKKYGFKLKTSDITEIKNYVIRKTYVKREKFDSDIDIINLKNGLYNWRTGEFIPHTPDYLSLNQKPIIYNPKVRPKLFIKFLREVLYPQDIRTAIETIAYSFIRKNLFEHYFILIGTGANGKSVFIGILSNLHGLKNISNISLRSLGNHRFALADMVGKDINVDTELSSNTINDMSILKKLTGIQPLWVEEKNKPPYEAGIYAKQFFNANQLPVTSDDSDAHYRREIILSFPIQFEGEREDPSLLSKIISNEEEMSGIFNLVMNSMRTIINRGKIHVNSATIKKRRSKAKLIRDPIAAFLDEALTKQPQCDDFETSEDMHKAFSNFCKFHKLPILSSDTFSEKLRKDHGLFKERQTKDKKKKTIWKCKLVKWKDTGDSSQKTLMIEDEEDED